MSVRPVVDILARRVFGGAAAFLNHSFDLLEAASEARQHLTATDPRLANMVLVNNSRLSVQPVSYGEWKIIRAKGG